jgi:hypothetical protein
VRWWFGLGWIVMGLAEVLVAGPLWISRGNYGGIYLICGGAVVAVCGWLVHPWGLQRRSRNQAPKLLQA